MYKTKKLNQSIRLSPSHGVNPSVETCFLCQKDMSVILFGHQSQRGQLDWKAPANTCLGNHCDKCEEFMNKGIILISIDEEKSKGDMSNPYRTGGWVVVRDLFVERVVEPVDLRNAILNKRMAFISDETWDMLGLPRSDKSNSIN